MDLSEYVRAWRVQHAYDLTDILRDKLLASLGGIDGAVKECNVWWPITAPSMSIGGPLTRINFRADALYNSLLRPTVDYPPPPKLLLLEALRLTYEGERPTAPETINIPTTDTVPEIQVFGLTIRGDKLKDDLLLCIDRAIPFPLLFALRRPGQVNYTAAYKRPSETGSGIWVTSGYFTSGWLPNDSPRMPLPLALNMESLYAALLAPLLPYPAKVGESLAAYMARVEKIQTLERQAAKLEASMRKEKQFNRKVALNQDLRALREQIAPLSASQD